MSKKTVFNDTWLTKLEYSAWLGKHASKYMARCTVCPKDFELGNMGRRALTSHAGGAKHKSKLQAKKSPLLFLLASAKPS